MRSTHIAVCAIAFSAFAPSVGVSSRVVAAAGDAVEGDSPNFDVAAVSWDECVDCGDGAPVDCGCGVGVAPVGYGGPICTRTTLTGDWLGTRGGLAASGVSLVADSTNFYVGNTSGGVRRDFAYGAHNDYVFNVDGGKLGVQEGMFLKVRGEHRMGDSISPDSGAILPPYIETDLPFPDSDHVYLTNVLLTQFLSESFGVFAGKLDTFDADTNAFASGRGKTQFSNIGFVATPIALRTAPYSTLGAGFIVLRDKLPIFSFTVLNATNTAKTSGFDELFNDGCTLAPELRLPTTFLGLPGHQLFGGTWSSRNVVSLGQDPRILLPDVPIARQSDSWSLYWNCDQYVFVDPVNPQRGWGFFSRAAIADQQTNPIGWFLSAGIGGAGPLVTRPTDTWGLGWYTAGTSDRLGPIIATVLGPIGDGHAVELFYNAAVTPWCHVTPDLQVIVPARESVDAALLAGVRANVNF